MYDKEYSVKLIEKNNICFHFPCILLEDIFEYNARHEFCFYLFLSFLSVFNQAMVSYSIYREILHTIISSLRYLLCGFKYYGYKMNLIVIYLSLTFVVIKNN